MGTTPGSNAERLYHQSGTEGSGTWKLVYEWTQSHCVGWHRLFGYWCHCRKWWILGRGCMFTVHEYKHINLAELNTVLRGINLVLQWKAAVVHLKADSDSSYILQLYTWKTMDSVYEKFFLNLNIYCVAWALKYMNQK